MLAIATDSKLLAAGLSIKNVAYQVQQDAAGQRSLSFTQGGHTFQGAELGPAYSVEGMKAQMQANREAQPVQPAAQFVPDVARAQGGSVAAPSPAAPEQRPVAAQPPTPEAQPAPELKPALKPKPPQKRQGPRR